MCRLVDTLTRGSSVKFQGSLIPSPGPGQPVELQAKTLTVLGECDPLVSPSLFPSFFSKAYEADGQPKDVPHRTRLETAGERIV